MSQCNCWFVIATRLKSFKIIKVVVCTVRSVNNLILMEHYWSKGKKGSLIIREGTDAVVFGTCLY